MREEAFLGLWKPGWKRPVLAPFLASSRVPLPLCPVDILWDVSVYFGYRKHTVQATAATLFLDRPRMTFELCCSQSSSIYQMGETLRQLENARVPFFGSATACVSLRPVGEKAHATQQCCQPNGKESIFHRKKLETNGTGYISSHHQNPRWGNTVCESGDFGEVIAYICIFEGHASLCWGSFG